MPFQLIDIAVQLKQPHPRLVQRTTGKVRAVLTEDRDGTEHRHELSIPVWTDTGDTMTEADVDMALLVKAAAIIARVKLRLDGH